MIIRLLFFCLACTGVAWWLSAEWEYGTRIDAWRRVRESTPLEQILVDPPEAALSGQALVQSYLLQTERFPPDLAGARRLNEQWLPRDPLRSGFWTDLARINALTGRPDQARAALRRANELEPYYPRERLESIQIWALLGESDLARETALSIARFGGDYRLDAAEGLYMTGLATAAEVFVEVGGPQLGPAETLDLLQRLRTGSPGQLDSIYGRLSPENRNDERIRRVFLDWSGEAGAGELAWRIWLDLRPSAEWIELAPAGEQRLLMDNPQLLRPPFAEPLALGWLQPVGEPEFTLSWRPPGSGASEVGGFQLEYETGMRAGKRVSWRFHRLILPPTKDPLKVSIEARVAPPSRSVCRLVVKAANSSYASNKSSPETEDWQILAVEIPPSSSFRTAELVLERESQGERFVPAQVIVESLHFALAAGEPSSP